MFGGFVPREGKFFDLFNRLGDQLVLGAKAFKEMPSQSSEHEAFYRRIKDIEHSGDEITHETFALLHETFITPMDREDIRTLVSGLDDILDCMDAISARIFLYKPASFPPAISKFSELNYDSIIKVQQCILGLNQIKNPESILQNCVEIHRLENDADHLLRAEIGELFATEKDIRELIKLKEIYEMLELVTDKCEDVANVIEGIVLEYA